MSRSLALVLVVGTMASTPGWAATPGHAEVAAPKSRFRVGVPAPIKRFGKWFHKVSVDHGMKIGTGLIVSGVVAGEIALRTGHGTTAAALMLGAPFVGLKMNTIALGARIHDTYRRTEGNRFVRVLKTIRNESDAVAMKSWSIGLKVLGMAELARYGLGGEEVAKVGNFGLKLGTGLVLTGVALHVAPRVAKWIKGDKSSPAPAPVTD